MRIDHQELILFIAIASLLVSTFISFVDKSKRLKIALSTFFVAVGLFALALSDDRERLKEGISERQDQAGDRWLVMRERKIERWLIEIVIKDGTIPMHDVLTLVGGIDIEFSIKDEAPIIIELSKNLGRVIMVGKPVESKLVYRWSGKPAGNPYISNCIGVDVGRDSSKIAEHGICSIVLEIRGMPRTLVDVFEKEKIKVSLPKNSAEIWSSQSKINVALLASFDNNYVHAPTTINFIPPLILSAEGSLSHIAELSGEAIEEISRRRFERSSGNLSEQPFMPLPSLLQKLLFSEETSYLEDIHIFESLSRNFSINTAFKALGLDPDDGYQPYNIGQWCGFYIEDMCWNTYALGKPSN